MCYIHPAVRALKVSFLSTFLVSHFAVGKVAMATKTVYCFLVIRKDKVCFETCPIQLFFIMIVDVGTILFQLKSTVIASIEYLYASYASQIMAQPYAKSQPLVTFSDAHNTHVGSP